MYGIRSTAATVALASILALLISGCGVGSTFPPSGVAPSQTSSEAALASAVSNANPSRHLEPIKLDFTAPDGGSVTVEFDLSPIVRAVDPEAVDYFGGSSPCGADPTRDAATYGLLTITNNTPNFSTRFRMPISVISGSQGNPSLSFGAVYSSGTKCIDLDGEYGSGDSMSPAVSPNWTGAIWGPVRVEFVFHNAYSPASPNSPATLTLPNVSGLLGAYGDGAYAIHSDSPYVTFVGPLAKLHVDRMVDNAATTGNAVATTPESGTVANVEPIPLKELKKNLGGSFRFVCVELGRFMNGPARPIDRNESPVDWGKYVEYASALLLNDRDGEDKTQLVATLEVGNNGSLSPENNPHGFKTDCPTVNITSALQVNNDGLQEVTAVADFSMTALPAGAGPSEDLRYTVVSQKDWQMKLVQNSDDSSTVGLVAAFPAAGN